MIVHPRPYHWRLLFTLRGSIIPAIAPKLAAIGLLAIVITWLTSHWPLHGLPPISLAPFTLLGLALTIFLSFRNNACYERWWEARKLWGELIYQTRGLSRLTQTLLTDSASQQRITRLTIGFAHGLTARLRGNDVAAALLPWSRDEDHLPLLRHPNPLDLSVSMMAQTLQPTLREGRLDPYLYGLFEARFQAMSGIQAGCERIAFTPLPFAYTLLLHRSAWLFCGLLPFGLVSALGWATPVVSMLLAYAFFGLDRLGDEMEDPLGLEANDLALDAMTRTIEIDLLAALAVAPLPEPLRPENGLLQ